MSASAFAGGAWAAPARAGPVVAAGALYQQGEGVTARSELARLVDDPQHQAPAAQAAALQRLLDVCIHTYADDCTVKYAGRYLQVFDKVQVANPIQKRELGRRALYYADYAKWRAGVDPKAILKGSSAVVFNPGDFELYVRRQLLIASLHVAADEPAAAAQSADRLLSLIASIKNPQDNRPLIAWALADTIDTLLAVGETERAYGLYKVSDEFIGRALPPLSADAVAYRLTEARVLEETGDLKGSAQALDIAVAALGRIELDKDVHDAWLASALTLKAVVCTVQGQTDCADRALRNHPYARLYAKAGRVAASYNEVSYLAARSLAGAVSNKTDPAAAFGLKTPAAANDSLARTREIYRVAGEALALPPGAERDHGLIAAGRAGAAAARTLPAGAFGAWYRPGVVDQVVIALSLGRTALDDGPDADATAFDLFQLAGRRGASFDSDAFSILAQARDQSERRSIHQALRLRARRDRLEREQIQKMLRQAAATAPQASPLTHDTGARWLLRDFSVRIDQASRGLAERGLSTSGANLVSLKDFQARLGPGEAALTVAQVVGGGAAYMCVRRDGAWRQVARVDWQKVHLDSRVVQNALTASYAPSDTLDSQFPVAAAMRLYDALIRPFEGCLKSGDHILWLPGMSITPVPLAVLLDHAPPKLGDGYDLAAAAWLARRYAITYAGSAGVVLAARSGARPAKGDLDFLGVGDPILTGAAAGQARGVRGGLRLADLAPLPETKAELERSAKGFAGAKLLMRGEATEQGFRSQLIGSYRYLSFATHGLLRDDVQGLSDPALVLTPVSADNAANDGLLTASEIADLNLSAGFVALSACNTANFDLTQMTEDLPALSSAFAVAGVPATLATLWPVDSESSARIVAQTFAQLQASPNPGAARALAEAQRAFLAAPPSRAYLHPRFWAPFVILGDGGAHGPAPRKDGLTVASTTVLTRRGGEVLGLDRHDDQVAASFISDTDAKGRHGGSIRLAKSAGGQLWRHDSDQVGATRFVVRLGGRLVTGGYRRGPDGRAAPVLEAFDAASGKPAKTWTGQVAPGLNGFVFGGARTGPRKAVVAVGDLNFTMDASRGGPHLHIYEVDDSLTPRKLLDIDPPAGVGVDSLSVAPLGDDLLVAYSDRYPRNGDRAPIFEDDYDQPICGPAPVTRLELRDGRDGRLKASTALAGVIVSVARRQAGRTLLGGATRGACGSEVRAAVMQIGADLQPKLLFQDQSLGGSEVIGLSDASDGGLVAVGRKENVVDLLSYGGAKPAAPNQASPAQFSGMVVALPADGGAPRIKMLDAGLDIFASAVTADGTGGVLVGGAVGDQAAIFRLSAATTGARPSPAR